MLIAAAVSNVLVPRLTILWRDGDRVGMVAVWREAMRKTSLVLLPMFAFMTVMSADLVRLLYGAGYSESVAVFRVYLFLLPLRIATWGLIPQAIGRTGINFQASLLILLVERGDRARARRTVGTDRSSARRAAVSCDRSHVLSRSAPLDRRASGAGLRTSPRAHPHLGRFHARGSPSAGNPRDPNADEHPAGGSRRHLRSDRRLRVAGDPHDLRQRLGPAPRGCRPTASPGNPPGMTSSVRSDYAGIRSARAPVARDNARAGTPPTTAPSPRCFVTTAPAPTSDASPIVTPAVTTTCAVMTVRAPMTTGSKRYWSLSPGAGGTCSVVWSIEYGPIEYSTSTAETSLTVEGCEKLTPTRSASRIPQGARMCTPSAIDTLLPSSAKNGR